MSSSSDSSADDDHFEFIAPPSFKHGRTISHPGVPNPQSATFAPIPKRIRWPDDLWESGTLIYDIQYPQSCLGPPNDRNDKTLRFDSRFESGNLMFAYQLTLESYHLILEYDHNKSGSCQWFYFQVSNVRKDTKYQFYISGFHKNSGVYKSGSKVFWYSVKQYQKDGISWSRGGSNYMYGVTSKKGKNKRSSLQFQIKFPYDDDVIYLCYALPYTYTQLKNSISQWKNDAKCNFSVSTLCTTLGGKECPLLTLESATSPIPVPKRDCIVLTARIHPGESNGSYVIHGLIDFLISSNPAASYLLENNIIKIIPMVNIDGVVEGFYRIGLGGVDLNRMWQNPDPYAHPVIYAIKELIRSIQKEHKISAYIDFHGHSRLHGTFAYGCPNDDGLGLIHSEKVFPRMVSYLTNAFSWANCVFSFPLARKAASRIVMRKEFNILQSFTIESSFGGISIGPRTGVLYDETIWKEIGQKCGEALYHLLSKSPIYQFCMKEMSYLTPQQDPNGTANIEKSDSDIENKTNSTNSDDNENDDLNNQRNFEVQITSNTYKKINISDDLTFNTAKLTKPNGHPVMLKLGTPMNFLINATSISTQPSVHIEPKWNQMQYTPK